MARPPVFHSDGEGRETRRRCADAPTYRVTAASPPAHGTRSREAGNALATWVRRHWSIEAGLHWGLSSGS
jgi:hypothetical protein